MNILLLTLLEDNLFEITESGEALRCKIANSTY